jgi:hypothetical protein
MLWIVFGILGVLWVLAIPAAYTIGELIHVLIVFAVVAAMVRLLRTGGQNAQPLKGARSSFDEVQHSRMNLPPNVLETNGERLECYDLR